MVAAVKGTMTSRVALLVALALALMGFVGSAADARTESATSPVTGPTTSLVGIPVVPCRATSGTSQSPTAGVPRLLAATISKASSKRLTFYSNGVITVLGPKGWACTSLFAADGGESLAAFPPGQADPTLSDAPGTAQGVIARVDFTGHGPGVALACGLFPNAPAVKNFGPNGGFSCSLPAAEVTERPTPDLAIFHDPVMTKGSGDLSGGPHAVSGVVILPESDPGSVGNISKATCALASRDSDLCPAIVSDFVVRAFPSEVLRPGQ
jgi:hypothetical protein